MRREKMEGLLPTCLHDEQIGKWVQGEKEDRPLIPKGYCGDPAGALWMESDMTTADRVMARDIVSFLQKRNRMEYPRLCFVPESRLIRDISPDRPGCGRSGTGLPQFRYPLLAERSGDSPGSFRHRSIRPGTLAAKMFLFPLFFMKFRRERATPFHRKNSGGS